MARHGGRQIMVETTDLGNNKMRSVMDICRFVAFLSIVLFVDCVNAVAADESTAETDKIVEESRIAWNKFLSANCSEKDTEQTIRKLMDGKYREIGFFRANNETHRLLFVIDDFHEVYFAFFDKNSRLMYTPRVEPKGQWLRMPNGYVKSIPSPAEMKLQTKVDEAALDYVVKHTNRERESLRVTCRRSENAPTWDVVVTINTLELDAPAYVLEITNDGVVVKGPFKDASESKTTPSRN
jgi:hypothetical protein